MKASFLRYAEGRVTPFGGRRFKGIENVILFEEVGSTNEVSKGLVEWILNESESLAPTAVVAAEQTAGRGRAGRTWTSPGGSSLAVSLIVPWPEGPERVRLPVSVGIALARGLTQRLGVDVRLKWPNDLMHGKKKLGGILVEARTGDEGEGFAIVGIGINLTSTRSQLDEAGLPEATSLALSGVPLHALDGEAPLLTLLEVLDDAVTNPVGDLAENFSGVSAHAPGDSLTVTDSGRGPVRGRFLGVTEDGALRLETEGGTETVVTGDVTIF
ncbi:MAG TPA: biotin--[acetyl-CoA-carboxylase] ligase [Thermoanaerobaculia bacterium]|nr:biotin--[acetyl-CoA-carboxylase] ligase [Thermoanaerobaculia bacterium]